MANARLVVNPETMMQLQRDLVAAKRYSDQSPYASHQNLSRLSMFCATLLLASPLTCKTAHTPPQRRRAQLVPAFELSADFSVRNNQGWTSQRLHVEGLRRWYKTNDYCRVPAMIRSASSAFSMKEVLPQVRRRFRSCSSLRRSGSLAEDRITTQ